MGSGVVDNDASSRIVSSLGTALVVVEVTDAPKPGTRLRAEELDEGVGDVD